MTKKRWQKFCTPSYQNLGKNYTEIYDMVKTAFGEDSMSRAQVFFNGFAVIKKGEHLRKAMPSSKQDATVAHSFLLSRRCCVSWFRCRGSNSK
jgi:hypothetical protein